MKLKQYQLVLLCTMLFIAPFVAAQELVMPLQLKTLGVHQTKENIEKTALLKSGNLQIPFIEYFENNGKPKPQYWLDTLVELSNRTALFNNLDPNGNVYANSNGLADQLTSNPISLIGYNLKMYFGFQIASGNSFVVGDSIVLEFLNKQQVWDKVWGSTVLLSKFKEVLIPVDLETYSSEAFVFRFSLFAKSTQASAQIYQLKQVVLAPMLGVPFNMDNCNAINKDQSFTGLDVQIKQNVSSQELGNGFVLDAYDYQQQAYSNGYNAADTFYMHPISMLTYNSKDSVKLAFTLKTLTAWKNTDTLVFECRNNLGNWVPMLVFYQPTDSIQTFNFAVNSGRFRHAFFAARWFLKTVAIPGDTDKVFVSAIQVYKQIYLPVLEDFSSSDRLVDPMKWQNNFVYVNNEFPENQPSINVATFDGLNEKGNPYALFPIKGTADVMTSWVIDLSKASPSDSLYLSFYSQYELQGTTEQIFPDDSFVVEYRNSKYQSSTYTPLKRISAIDATKHQFDYHSILIKDSACFHDKFEIRFRNRGSLTGNLSQWHLDYIYLNKGRTATDAINDVSLTNTPHPYLGLYYAMPWKQYNAEPNKYPTDTATLRFKNHDNQSFVLDYSRTTSDNFGNTIAQYQNFTNIEALSDTFVKFQKPIPYVASSIDPDSIVFTSKYKVGFSSAKNDLIASNDTMSVSNVFSNFLAYDDGSAEGGYGIKNKTNCGAALQFELSVPDTLYGVYMFFNQSEQNVANQQFGLRVWKQISAIGGPANDDQIIYKVDNLTPTYLNAINAYSYLKFNQPVPVEGKFYIGWEQAQAYVLNIGLDKNFPFGVNQNLFYKQDGQWYPTTISGTPMMRPMIGKWIDLPAAINEPILDNQQIDFMVYPNPSNGIFTVQSESMDGLNASVFDMSGRLLCTISNIQQSINLSQLENGIYLMQLNSPKTNQSKTTRIIIQQ